MKTKSLYLYVILFCAGMFTSQVYGQDKVRRQDVEGKTWQLKIDIKEEIEEELDEADDVFERIIVKSVAGFVDGILDGIDIYFEFRPDNDLKITVEALGEREIEWTTWYINRDGALVIEDTDSFDTDDDDIWLFVDDVLVAFDEDWDGDLDDQPVYLVRID